MVYADIVVGDFVDMNKQKFLKFMVDEIERQQKDMYKSGEGKKVVFVLSQIYTLASDGKFDISDDRRGDIADEIRRVHSAQEDSVNYNKGQIMGSYKRSKGKITGPWKNHSGGE